MVDFGLLAMLPVTLGASGLVIGILTTLFIAVCVIMILTVLIQRPQGGGLSGAFGSGAGSGQTAFGARTGDALTIATISMFVVFITMAVVLNFIVRPATPQREATQATAPAESGGAGAATDDAPDDTTDDTTTGASSEDDAAALPASEVVTGPGDEVGENTGPKATGAGDTGEQAPMPDEDTPQQGEGEG